MSAAELKVRLTIENAKVTKLTTRDLRAGTGPSEELKKTSAQAKRTWRLWSNALDIEAGRKPCFPVDADGRFLASAGGAK